MAAPSKSLAPMSTVPIIDTNLSRTWKSALKNVVIFSNQSQRTSLESWSKSVMIRLDIGLRFGSSKSFLSPLLASPLLLQSLVSVFLAL